MVVLDLEVSGLLTWSRVKIDLVKVVYLVSGQNGPKSKRPQVKTAPNWSKRPQLQLQIGQNCPKNGLKFDLGFK